MWYYTCVTQKGRACLQHICILYYTTYDGYRMINAAQGNSELTQRSPREISEITHLTSVISSLFLSSDIKINYLILCQLAKASIITTMSWWRGSMGSKVSHIYAAHRLELERVSRPGWTGHKHIKTVWKCILEIMSAKRHVSSLPTKEHNWSSHGDDFPSHWERG